MAKAGLQEPKAKVPKNQAEEFCPPENNDLAVESHLKSLDKEEKSRNKRASVVSTFMRNLTTWYDGVSCRIFGIFI